MRYPKIVFLDFDGVLNSAEFKVRLQREEGPKSSMWNRLDAMAVARLNRLLKATGAVVVVSSSWRLFRDTGSVAALRGVLGDHGFQGTVIGKTPHLGECIVHDGFECDQAHRGFEIDQWLVSEQAISSEPRPTFVILDDNSDMIPHMDRLVQTNWETGLLDAHVDRCIEMLGAA